MTDPSVRVIAFQRFGGPEVLEVLRVDEPHAGPGQVRIRVSAVAVSPSDVETRSGAAAAQLRRVDPNFRVPRPPHIVGWDVAGVIDEVGAGVTGLATGDRVVAVTNPYAGRGAYVESLVVAAESAVLAPANVDDAAACTLPMNALTARLALDKLALPAGATVAVTGAAGTLGGYVVQLAKADGLRVIADASETDEELVSSLGADVVVGRGPDVAKNILQSTPDGVDAVVDTAVQDDAVLAAVRDGGAIVTLRGYSGPTERGITWHPIYVAEYVGERARLDRLARQVEAGELTLRVADTYPADRAADAHRRMEGGGVRGRLVISF